MNLEKRGAPLGMSRFFRAIRAFVPGARAGSGGGAIFAVFFYIAVLVVAVRVGLLIEMIGAGDGRRAISDVGAILCGILGFYGASVLPGFIERRPMGKSYLAAVKRFQKNVLAVTGLVLFLSFLSVALLAPLVAPYPPHAQHEPAVERYQPPSTGHLLGTDRLGRDVLSRIIYGSRISLAVGVLAVLLAALAGTFLGAIAGYFGGWVENLLMRIVDGLLAFPRLLLVLTLVAFFAGTLAVTILVLAATGWMGVSRLVRAEVLRLKEREFIDAAVAAGVGRMRIIWKHLIPNTLGPVVVNSTLRIGTIVLLESYLSFLGLGVQPPDPSWGSMVFEGRAVLLSAWWVSAMPGLAIVTTVVACNLLGDGLRDATDVKAA